MVVRDSPGGAAGIEVFMLRRSLDADFAGGAYVFPGGAVDDADRHTDLDLICRGRRDASASALLGIEAGGLAFWVAAIRETFEEAGILLAYRADGEVVHLTEPATVARFRQHRADVHSGRRRLVEVCIDEGLVLAVDTIHYVSHWITPRAAPKRFDTRFFVAAAPEEQTPLHDDRETIESLWIRPAEALDRASRGELELILPTMRNLEAIARFERSADLLRAASGVLRG